MSKRILVRALLVLEILALNGIGSALPPRSAVAQDECRTFPETGKTVCGRFLQYWQQHGALAQQGFPISEAIQETSATDGKIYTVQYFERAIFEYHPENQPPYDVLLSLLGVFVYDQKYPQGATGAQPNTAPGSRLFAETGHRLGGIFDAYWRSHGGLAQQGFPISDEFQEKSDLNGQTYRVQYFQRAVFESHPENAPPFNVLLSQLGTFRSRTRYANTLAQRSGSGNQVPAMFALKRGLAVFQSVRAYGGYYYIDALDAGGQQIGTIGAGSGPNDESVAVPIAADGMYGLRVQAEGGWTVNVSQPTATYAAPPARQQWRGHGWQATPLFSLKTGPAHFHAVSPNDQAAQAQTPARVDLLDQEGTQVGSFAAGTDPIDVTTDLTIPADGVYLLRVYFYQADWTISVEQ
jgi:hypothetical protein